MENALRSANATLEAAGSDTRIEIKSCGETCALVAKNPNKPDAYYFSLSKGMLHIVLDSITWIMMYEHVRKDKSLDKSIQGAQHDKSTNP